MVLIDLQKVLATLGLVSSIAKPIPLVGSVASGLLDSAGSVIGSTAGSGTGAFNGLLGGGTGLIAAVGVADNETAPSLEGTTATSNATVAGLASSLSFNGTSLPVNGTSNAPNVSNVTSSSLPIPTGSDSSSINSSSITALDSCAFEPYSPPSPVTLQPFAAYDASQALIYRYRQQQSVNLGSWFVQEQWMNPSLFACASGNKQAELDVANGWGSVDNARQVLERHWDEWITESDFQYLATIGINTVRLPIGFWSVGPVYSQGTPFEAVAEAYVNAWPRVVRAINWAAKYGLGVLVDLHGAPGSQNGQAHSGVSDGQQNLFNDPANVQLTLNVLTYLTQQLVKVNNVVGIQILNEPSNVDGLPAFYSQVLTTLRQVSPEAASFPFYINDAFDMSRFADYISTRQDFVVLDHHSYFVFGDANSQATPASQLITTLQPGQGSLSQQMASAANEERRNIVIDEFSCALSQQALSNSADASSDRRQFCTGQMESYANATAGYSFWSYKTESCATDVNWCFTGAVGNTLPSTFFSYPKTTIQAINGDSSSAQSDSASPAGTSFLSFGTSSPSVDSDYSPPTTDDWLAAMGNSDTEFSQVTEALATTEYDEVPNDSSASTSLSAVTPSSSQPAAFYASSADNAQAPYMINSATIPSSRLGLQNQGARRRSLSLTTLPQRAFLLSTTLGRHRFVARHLRAASRGQTKSLRRDDSTGEQNIMYTPEQAAIAKGYADGWKAAKTFAAFSSSRLGFTGQFITDALAAMSDKIVSSDEQFYRTWFMKGLADGEVQVIKLLALQNQGPQQ